MSEFSKYVGMDTHEDTIAVAVCEACGGKPGYYGDIPNTAAAVAKRVKEPVGGRDTLRWKRGFRPCCPVFIVER